MGQKVMYGWVDQKRMVCFSVLSETNSHEYYLIDQYIIVRHTLDFYAYSEHALSTLSRFMSNFIQVTQKVTWHYDFTATFPVS